MAHPSARTAKAGDVLMQLQAVSKEYKTGPVSFFAVQKATLTLRAGEFVLLQGPSGSGKTTLLSIMGMLMKPSSGRVLLCNQEVTSLGEDVLPLLRLRHIGFIFQTYNLFPALTAFQNVTLALKLKGYGYIDRRREAKRLLDRVGLSSCMNRRPDELSGGQRQRVSIARAMTGDADVLLADEPTAALDTVTGLEIMTLLRDEVRSGRKAAFVVTHDPRLEKFATRVDRILDGQLTVAGGGHGEEAHAAPAAASPAASSAPVKPAEPKPEGRKALITFGPATHRDLPDVPQVGTAETSGAHAATPALGMPAIVAAHSSNSSLPSIKPSDLAAAKVSGSTHAPTPPLGMPAIVAAHSSSQSLPSVKPSDLAAAKAESGAKATSAAPATGGAHAPTPPLGMPAIVAASGRFKSLGNGSTPPPLAAPPPPPTPQDDKFLTETPVVLPPVPSGTRPPTTPGDPTKQKKEKQSA